MSTLAKMAAGTLALVAVSTGLSGPIAADPMCYGCYATFRGPGYYPPGGYAAGYYRPFSVYPPPAYQMASPYNQRPYVVHYVYPVPYVYPAPHVYPMPHVHPMPPAYPVPPVDGPPACSGYDRHCPQ